MVKDQNEKTSKVPQGQRTKDDVTLVDPADEIMPTYAVESEEGPEEEREFPNEWISIAAYYIWKGDGQPEGRDAEYWERAKIELRQLQKKGGIVGY
jgi:hypothetical protein